MNWDGMIIAWPIVPFFLAFVKQQQQHSRDSFPFGVGKASYRPAGALVGTAAVAAAEEARLLPD